MKRWKVAFWNVIGRLESYLDKKRLEVDMEKTKIMKYKKEGGRMSKRDWRWKGKRIEVVKEFRYLGYVMQRNGEQEAYVKDRVKRAAAIMEQVWGIGKRRFRDDWGRRLWLFDRLVWRFRHATSSLDRYLERSKNDNKFG